MSLDTILSDYIGCAARRDKRRCSARPCGRWRRRRRAGAGGVWVWGVGTGAEETTGGGGGGERSSGGAAEEGRESKRRSFVLVRRLAPSVQQTWTALQRNARDHLGCAGCRDSQHAPLADLFASDVSLGGGGMQVNSRPHSCSHPHG